MSIDNILKVIIPVTFHTATRSFTSVALRQACKWVYLSISPRRQSYLCENVKELDTELLGR